MSAAVFRCDECYQRFDAFDETQRADAGPNEPVVARTEAGGAVYRSHASSVRMEITCLPGGGPAGSVPTRDLCRPCRAKLLLGWALRLDPGVQP